MKKVTFRVKEVLEDCGTNVYQVAELTKGRLSRTQLYSMVNHGVARVDLRSLEALLDALDTLGCEVTLNDFFGVEDVEDTNAQ